MASLRNSNSSHSPLLSADNRTVWSSMSWMRRILSTLFPLLAGRVEHPLRANFPEPYTRGSQNLPSRVQERRQQAFFRDRLRVVPFG